MTSRLIASASILMICQLMMPRTKYCQLMSGSSLLLRGQRYTYYTFANAHALSDGLVGEVLHGSESLGDGDVLLPCGDDLVDVPLVHHPLISPMKTRTICT